MRKGSVLRAYKGGLTSSGMRAVAVIAVLIILLGGVVFYHTALAFRVVDSSIALESGYLGCSDAIEVVFSRPVDPRSLARGSVVLMQERSGERVEVSAQLVDARTVRIEPSERLRPDTSFVLAIDPTVRSVLGNSLGSEWVTAFYTVPPPSPTTPENVLACVEGTGSVRVVWDTASCLDGVSSYAVYRGTKPITPDTLGFASVLTTVAANQNSITVAIALDEAEKKFAGYYYSVRAVSTYGRLSVFSASSLPNPHGPLGEQDTNMCARCHTLHAAGSLDLGAAGAARCYGCHGATSATSDFGAGATFDAQADFFDDPGNPLPTTGSRHRNDSMVASGKECTGCHAVHLSPYSPIPADSYERLLRVATPPFVRNSSAAPVGNALCLGCHGSQAASIVAMGLAGGSGARAASAGDHESGYSGSAHATDTVPASAANPRIQCNACHAAHSSPVARLVDYRASGVVTTENADAGLCFKCHGSLDQGDGTPNTWNGRVLAQEFGRASHHPTATVDGVTCVSCHNPHLVAEGDASAWDLSRASNPDNTKLAPTSPGTLCLACHDATPPTAVVSEDVLVPRDVIFTPASSPLFPGWDKSAAPTSGHWTAGVECDNCHDPHGSDQPRLLAFSGADDKAAGGTHAVRVARVNQGAGYAEEELCYACHADRGGLQTCTACHPRMYDIKKQTDKTLYNENTWNVEEVRYSTAYSGRCEDIYDIDNDGLPDIVGLDRMGLYYHRKTNVAGTAWTTTLVESVVDAGGYALKGNVFCSAADVDGDLDGDIAVTYLDGAGYTHIYLYRNISGDGITWSRSTVYDNPVFTGQIPRVEFSDIDGDGDQDIVAHVTGTTLSWWENLDGIGGSWTERVITTTRGSQRWDVVDIDQDGDTDIIAFDNYMYERAWYNDGTGVFTGVVMETSSTGNGGAASGDIDGDGDLDVVLARRPSSGQGSIMIDWNTDGLATAWTTEVINTQAGQPHMLSVVDYDLDGDLDILVKRDGSVLQLENLDGVGGEWRGSIAFAFSWTSLNMVVADMDQDGDPDFANVGGRYVQLVRNMGHTPLVTGAHPTNSAAGSHTDTETASRLGSARHAECPDCHDPHAAQAGAHAMGTNTASGPIRGATGVAITNSTTWTIPAYSPVADVTYEYQLCFKCHSAYANGYSGQDLSVKFNPANGGLHPIEGPGANLGIPDAAFTLGTPWNPTAGDDADYTTASPKMTCSDCHASENAADPRGPHGSRLPSILRLNSTTEYHPIDGSQNALCLMCHDTYTYTVNSATNSRFYHDHILRWGVATCTSCHDPHGTQAQHLMKPGVTYAHTATGGVVGMEGCEATCHSGPYAYTSNY